MLKNCRMNMRSIRERLAAVVVACRSKTDSRARQPPRPRFTHCCVMSARMSMEMYRRYAPSHESHASKLFMGTAALSNDVVALLQGAGAKGGASDRENEGDRAVAERC